MLLSRSLTICALYFYQFSMPISSSRASMPSAWCRVVWEKTRQCTLLLAPPWCTQRRLSPSRDALLSSTTPMVSTQAFLKLSLSLLQTQRNPNALSTSPGFFSHSAHFAFALFILHPVSFSTPSAPSYFFSHGHFVLWCSCFPPHLIIFLSFLIRLSFSHHHWFLLIPFHTLSLLGCIACFSCIIV